MRLCAWFYCERWGVCVWWVGRCVGYGEQSMVYATSELFFRTLLQHNLAGEPHTGAPNGFKEDMAVLFEKMEVSDYRQRYTLQQVQSNADERGALRGPLHAHIYLYASTVLSLHAGHHSLQPLQPRLNLKE